jgi:hypothetical protein
MVPNRQTESDEVFNWSDHNVKETISLSLFQVSTMSIVSFLKSKVCLQLERWQYKQYQGQFCESSSI